MTAPNVPFTPTKPITHGAASLGSQRGRRWTDTFFDNHRHAVKFPNGRPWTGEREMKSGTEERSETAGFITSDLQCGAFFCEGEFQTPQERMETLASCWQAPWTPIAKYFRFNYRTKRISFAYDRMIADEREGMARYFAAAAKMAGDGDVIDPEFPAKVPTRIRLVMGSPFVYLNQIKLAQAAQAGDPWLLGFVSEPNTELAKILGVQVNFIGGHAADREYTETKLAPEPKAVLTPDQVLAAPPTDLAKLIADAVAAAMAVRDAQDAAKKQADKERMAKLRDAKKAKGAAA